MVRLTEYPEEGELVMCSVRRVTNYGAIVTLDEYEHREGFIHVREVASGWVKYIRNYVREGQKVVCKVLKVDESKGQIDLSLKQVNEHQRREKVQEWKNEQRAEKLFEIVAEKLKKDTDECYKEFGYDLVRVFGTLYGAFEDCASDPKVLEKEGFTGKWTKVFVKVAKENIIPPRVEVKSEIEVVCPGFNGIDKIKDAFAKGVASRRATINIQYIGAPKYRIYVKAKDYKIAEKELEKCISRISKHISAFNGKVEVSRK